MELFRLFGSILIDDKDAIDKLDKTEKKAKDTSKSFGDIVSGAAKVGTAVYAGATAAAGALFTLASNTADAAGAIDDAAQRTGTSAEEYQKWTYAAKLSGIEASKLEALMVKQQTTLSNAADGSKTAAAAYEQLGIDITNLSSGDAFNQVIEQLANMDDETQRNSIANDIFGKSYADLAPLLNEGADGILKLKQEAEELGGVMSNESVAAGADFGDTMDKLKTSFGGVLNTLGGSLLPVAQKFAEMLIANMPKIMGVIDKLIPVITQMFEQLLPPIMQLVEMLLPILIELFISIMPLIVQLAQAFMPFVDILIKYIIPPLINIIQELLPVFIDIIILVAGVISRVLTPTFKVLGDVINALVPIFRDTFQAIYDVVKPIINFIIDGINKFIDGINGIKIPTWVPIVGGKSLNIPTIPKLEVGMDYVPYDNYLALLHKGERVMTAEENKLGSGMTVNFYPQSLSEAELDNAFNYMNRRFGMGV